MQEIALLEKTLASLNASKSDVSGSMSDYQFGVLVEEKKYFVEELQRVKTEAAAKTKHIESLELEKKLETSKEQATNMTESISK